MVHLFPSHRPHDAGVTWAVAAGHDTTAHPGRRGRWPLARRGQSRLAAAISLMATIMTMATTVAITVAMTVVAIALVAAANAPATVATATSGGLSVATTGRLSVAAAIPTGMHEMATWPLPVASQPAAGAGPTAAAARGLVPVALAPAQGPADRCQAQPSPSPPPAPAPEAPERPSSEGEGWLSRVWSAASEWFADQVVLPGVDPLLRLLGGTVLAAPDPSCMPAMVELWQSTRGVAVALFGVLVLAGSLLVMGQGTVQARYGLRELIPRMLIGFAAANLSLWLIGQAVTAANALTTAVLGGVDPQATATALRDLITNADQREGGLWLIFVVAAFLVIVVFIVIGYVMRLALLAILTVAAPLALSCHALPGLDRLAAWWWRALVATLGAQFAQALTFVIALRVFLAPGGLGNNGQLAEPVMRLFLALGVVLIMAMIPIHVMRAAKIGQGGSLIGTAMKTVLAVKTLGALRAGAHTAGTHSRTRPRPTTPAAVAGRPRTAPRSWPFGAGTRPAGRSVAEARRAAWDRAPGPARSRPGRLDPPRTPGPPRQPNRLHPPVNDWQRAHQPPPPAPPGQPPPRHRTAPSGPPPGAPRRRPGRVDPPRAGGRATPPSTHPRTPPRTPRPPRQRTYQPRRQP
jgi:hypothetical protein